MLLSSDQRAFIADLGLGQVMLATAHTAMGWSANYAGGRGGSAGAMHALCKGGWDASVWLGLLAAPALLMASQPEHASVPPCRAAPEVLLGKRSTLAADM